MDELEQLLGQYKARANERFESPRYPAADAFRAASIAPRDGRRWMDRDIIKPKAVEEGRTKFLFSLRQVLTLAIMGPLVRIGMSPSEGAEIGTQAVDLIGDRLGQVFALAYSAGSALELYVARSEDGSLLTFTSRTAEEGRLPPVYVTIDVLTVARTVSERLGLIVMAGSAKDFREAAERLERGEGHAR